MVKKTVTVFNPGRNPVIIDNARPIGVGEWHDVAMTATVQALIDEGALVVPKMADPVVVDPPSIVDDVDEVPPVSSEVNDEEEAPAVEGQESQPKPVSISKRRRKTPPVKE